MICFVNSRKLVCDKFNNVNRYIFIKSLLNKYKTNRDITKIRVKDFFTDEKEMECCMASINLNECDLSGSGYIVRKTKDYFFFKLTKDFSKKSIKKIIKGRINLMNFSKKLRSNKDVPGRYYIPELIFDVIEISDEEIDKKKKRLIEFKKSRNTTIAKYIRYMHFLNKLETGEDLVKVYVKDFFKDEDELKKCYEDLSEFSFQTTGEILCNDSGYFYYYRKPINYNYDKEKLDRAIKIYTKELEMFEKELKVK